MKEEEKAGGWYDTSLTLEYFEGQSVCGDSSDADQDGLAMSSSSPLALERGTDSGLCCEISDADQDGLEMNSSSPLALERGTDSGHFVAPTRTAIEELRGSDRPEPHPLLPDGTPDFARCPYPHHSQCHWAAARAQEGDMEPILRLRIHFARESGTALQQFSILFPEDNSQDSIDPAPLSSLLDREVGAATPNDTLGTGSSLTAIDSAEKYGHSGTEGRQGPKGVAKIEASARSAFRLAQQKISRGLHLG